MHHEAMLPLARGSPAARMGGGADVMLAVRRRGQLYVVIDDFGTIRFSSSSKSDCLDYADALVRMGKAEGYIDHAAGE